MSTAVPLSPPPRAELPALPAPAPAAAGARASRPGVLAGAASLLVSGLLSLTWLWISLTLFVTGLASLPAALSGLLLLLPWAIAMRWAASFERRRARAVHGIDVVIPARRTSDRQGLAGWFLTLGLDLVSWQFWRSVLHHHLTMLVAMVPCALFWGGILWAWGIGEMLLLTDGPTDLRVLGARLGPLGLIVSALLAILLALAALAGGIVAERGLARVMLPSTDDALRTEVAELSQRRQGAVDAAEQERLRIERDLHDGVQPRLVALAMTLGLARSRLESDPQRAGELIDEAHAEAKSVMTDLRQLARGIHPAVLTDRGLDPALSALAARSAIPVDLHVQVPGRLGREQEAVAYFLVSEALTNIAKHSGARRARIDVLVPEGTAVLQVRIQDDGRGGAAVHRDGVSTGLAGLTDRVRAAGGALEVSSPAGGPTILSASLPLPLHPSSDASNGALR